MIARRSARLAAIAGGVILIAGLRLAPGLTGTQLTLLSAAWLLALAGILWLAFQILRSLIGTGAAALIVAAGAAAPILVTAIPTSPEWSLRLPCPRNWTWVPTWLLRPSPMASLRFEVGDARVKLCYGRPAARGRKMIGGSPVPFGRLWRTGANEPTTIITTAPIALAGVTIPRGRVSLYTVPGPETWEVIINGSTSQWGLESEYTADVRRAELGRAIVRAETTGEYRDRLAFLVEPALGAGAGAASAVVLEWEWVRVPLQVEQR